MSGRKLPSAKGLAGGQSAAQALEHWQARAQALLAFCRRNRRRLALVEAGSLRREPDPVLERVFAHLGQSLPGELQLVPVEEEADPVLTVIAFQAVAQSEAAKAMNGELEARAFPAGSGAECGLRAVDRAAEALARQAEAVRFLQAQNASLLAERGEREKLEDQLAKIQAALEAQARSAVAGQEELDLLMLQLHALQDELEAGFLQRRELEAAFSARKEELEQSGAEAESKAKLAAELQEQLAAREEEVKGLHGRIASLEAERVERDAWLQDKDAQLAALWQSTSWRVTAPMRRVKLAFTAKRED